MKNIELLKEKEMQWDNNLNGKNNNIEKNKKGAGNNKQSSKKKSKDEPKKKVNSYLDNIVPLRNNHVENMV